MNWPPESFQKTLTKSFFQKLMGTLGWSMFRSAWDLSLNNSSSNRVSSIWDHWWCKARSLKCTRSGVWLVLWNASATNSTGNSCHKWAQVCSRCWGQPGWKALNWCQWVTSSTLSSKQPRSTTRTSRVSSSFVTSCHKLLKCWSPSTKTNCGLPLRRSDSTFVCFHQY